MMGPLLSRQLLPATWPVPHSFGMRRDRVNLLRSLCKDGGYGMDRGTHTHIIYGYFRKKIVYMYKILPYIPLPAGMKVYPDPALNFAWP